MMNHTTTNTKSLQVAAVVAVLLLLLQLLIVADGANNYYPHVVVLPKNNNRSSSSSSSSGSGSNHSSDNNGLLFVSSSIQKIELRSNVNINTIRNIRAGAAAVAVVDLPSSKIHHKKSKLVVEVTPRKSGILNNVPIYKDEWIQFLATSFLMFFFIIMFTMTRDTKDALVVSNCGAEAIPFLKLYGVMPAAALFLVGYSKLSNVLSQTALFYATLLPFFVFYTVFAFVLFPARDAIHFLPPSAGIDGGVKNVAAVANLVRYWSYSLYFIVTELYAGAGVPLLFWQVSEFVFRLFIVFE